MNWESLSDRKFFFSYHSTLCLFRSFFFFAGLILRNTFFTISNLSKKTFLASLIIWFGILELCFANTKHFELASRDYPFNLLCILMAMAGSYVCMYVCIRLRVGINFNNSKINNTRTKFADYVYDSRL